MKLGITLPLVDIQGDPATVRDFAQAAEGLGYDHLGAPDHVLGVNVASRPDWGARNTSKDLFHDPFVLFGFLSACTKSDRVLHAGDDPAATADGAGRQAGGLPRRAFRRALPLRHRGRLEPRRVRRPQRELQRPRQAAGGAGRGHEGAVGRAARDLQGQVAHHRGCRHQSPPRPAAHPLVVRWP